MCEKERKLVGWLDGELTESEAAEVEQHLHACRQCREQLDRYKNVSGMISAFCDATLDAKKPARNMPTWAPVLGVAASLMLLIALFIRARVERSPAPPPMAAVARPPQALPAAAAPLAVASALPTRKTRVAMSHKLRKSEVPASAKLQNANRDGDWPTGPAIEIAIPGEALFPPGAVPPGFGFVADVNIATDGSEQRMRLYPQLTEFEGGPKQ